MLRAIVVAVLCAGCPGPLGPGETRCRSAPVFGVMTTKCETGPSHPQQVVVSSPAAAPAPAGWWCTARPDGFGACMRGPGQCEAYRAGAPSGDFAPCGFSQAAICAPAGCYMAPVTCATMERTQERDGSLCVVVQ